MSDLISRSALYDKLIYDTTKTATVTGGEYIATWRIADVIAEAPTIDAVPVDKIMFLELSVDKKTKTAKAVIELGDRKFQLYLPDVDVDVEPVVHGQWIPVPSSDMVTGKAYECSECKKMRFGSFKPNYCPNCGAKMEGE